MRIAVALATAAAALPTSGQSGARPPVVDGGGSAHAFLRKPGPGGRFTEIDSRAGQGGGRALPTWILF